MAIGLCAVRGHKVGLSDLWGRGREERDWREAGLVSLVCLVYLVYLVR